MVTNNLHTKAIYKELNLMVLLSGVNEFLLFKMIFQSSLRHHLQSQNYHVIKAFYPFFRA